MLTSDMLWPCCFLLLKPCLFKTWSTLSAVCSSTRQASHTDIAALSVHLRYVSVMIPQLHRGGPLQLTRLQADSILAVITVNRTHHSLRYIRPVKRNALPLAISMLHLVNDWLICFSLCKWSKKLQKVALQEPFVDFISSDLQARAMLIKASFDLFTIMQRRGIQVR